jgi:hypothetical protein
MENESKDIFDKLSAPFEVLGADGKRYPNHKWFTKTKKGEFAICVPYIDATQVSGRLNEVLGVDGWSNTLIEMSSEHPIICELTLIVNGKEITRSDIGTSSNLVYSEKAAQEKGRASDALKRAAKLFGVGEYLSEIQPVKLKKVASGGKTYAATEEGRALKTSDELTSYINMKHPLRAKLTEIYNALSQEQKEKQGGAFTNIWNALNE